MSRNKKKRIVSKIWSAAPILYFSTRGTTVQILKAIRFFISRRFIYEMSDTNIRDWSLAYSFNCGTDDFFRRFWAEKNPPTKIGCLTTTVVGIRCGRGVFDFVVCTTQNCLFFTSPPLTWSAVMVYLNQSGHDYGTTCNLTIWCKGLKNVIFLFYKLPT